MPLLLTRGSIFLVHMNTEQAEKAFLPCWKGRNSIPLSWLSIYQDLSKSCDPILFLDCWKCWMNIHVFINVSTFFTRTLAGYLLSFHPQCKVEQQSLMTTTETSRSSSSGCPCLFAGMLTRLSIRRTCTKSHTCFLAGCGRSGREEGSRQPFPSAMAGPSGVKRPSAPPCGSRQQCIFIHL